MSKLIRKSVGGLMNSDEIRLIETGVDVIGETAIVKLPNASTEKKSLIAQGIMREMRNVKSVFEQEGGIEGEYRLRRLVFLAGEDRTTTLHRENGCRFKVDIASCYFSPRLATERMRISDITRDGEEVLNMFAGVGPYSILIAKRRKVNVTSCEINKTAFGFHIENNALNKVEGKVKTLNIDASELSQRTKDRFNRILLPNPSQANLFLTKAVHLARPAAYIHYYRHLSGESLEEAKEKMKQEVSEHVRGWSKLDVRRVREVGPRWHELVADIQVN